MSKSYLRHALLKSAKARLDTFKYTIYESNAVSFMENGLYFQNNALICFSCSGGSNLDSIAENIQDIHLQDCQYIKGLDVSIYVRPNSEVGEYVAAKLNKPIEELYPRIANPACGDLRAFTPVITSKFNLHTIPGVQRREIEKPIKNALLNARLFYLLMRKEINRLDTFNMVSYKWPHTFINARQLVREGFYYTLIEDIICCYVCRICIGGFTRSSNVIEVHNRFSPDCPIRSEQYVINELGISVEKTCNESATVECKICYKRSICIVFDCNHLLCCHVCARSIQICPMCRAVILTKREVMIS